MTLEIWTIYVATVLALMSTPGPSQLLMLSNSGAHGLRRSLSTAAGDLSANSLQMLAAGLGLAAIIAASGAALAIIKWAGVAYLIWLGIRMIRRAKPNDPKVGDTKRNVSLGNLWMQGFITSAANPKAVVFFAALFPQFISADHAFWPQFLILSVTYIIMDGLFLSAYGAGASWIAARFKGAAKAWIERIGGSFMIVAAILLSFRSIARQ
ncbi:LysE family translocator [Aquicoccus porphyridii]|uniref:LysE family translocator n=1 Tax=Aquicoccus porphyridii TaxID=1852029 RepID=A0A5A9ZCQ2_9RHOB|nr:LysE family translocator [Aquicoccus porphyridii]KAA0914856.1 LysE family translocator [Aquicoccus porphyridii]RAI52596.1 LysE family translocator [Rhodobacteraceae bacterium AsT-22]